MTRHLRIRAAALAFALVLAGTGAAAPARAQFPAPPVSSLEPLRVGAYGGLALGHSTRAGVGTETGVTDANLALLLSGTLVRRLSYFGELEAASTTRENWTGRDADDALDLERLYLEYAFADAFRVRAGRFLTPVGQWNEIHAAPLTWTAHRPLTTYRPFAKSLTGVMVTGELGFGPRDAGYALYASIPGLSDEDSAFVRAIGGRGALELAPGLFVGVSGAAYRASRPVGPDDHEVDEPDQIDDGEVEYEHGREEDRETRGLLGLDLSWSVHGLEVLAEATALSSASTAPGERGVFVQAAVPLLRPVRLYAVGRTEYYDPVVDGPLRIHTLGLALRPSHYLTVKVERQITDRPSYRVGDGWYLSVSGIF
jgi:hypothetical protein